MLLTINHDVHKGLYYKGARRRVGGGGGGKRRVFWVHVHSFCSKNKRERERERGGGGRESLILYTKHDREGEVRALCALRL